MLSRVLHDFNFGAEICLQARSVCDLVQHKRFDLIVLDYAEADSRALLRHLRQPSLATRSQILAIVCDAGQGREAFEQEANMTLQRPIRADSVARCIRSLYGTILQERRVSFRHGLQIALTITVDGRDSMPATLQNISEGGMQLKCRNRIQPGAKISCAAPLPPGVIQTEGTVVWVGQDNRLGIQFSSIGGTDFSKLRGWLNTKFEAKFGNDESRALQTAMHMVNTLAIA